MIPNKAVIGLVATRRQAESIVDELQIAYFSRTGVSVLLRDQRGTRDFARAKNTKPPSAEVAGGIAGALVGLGLSETKAKQYERELENGNILVSVHVEGRDEVEDTDERGRAKAILERAGATDVIVTGERSTSAALP
jgi:hypothetical protein